jgi:hypothetical protein
MNQRLVIGLAAVLPAAVGHADVGGPYVAQVTFAPTSEVSLFVVPDGSGAALTEAVALPQTTVDATIRVQMVDSSGDPIAWFPAELMWLVFDAAAGTMGHCDDHLFQPDGDADADGWLTWTQPLRGGGWTDGPVWITYLGAPAWGFGGPVDPVAMRANSPDLSGDHQVNLTDIVLFSENLVVSHYHYRSDFNWDGVVNLADVVRFTQAIGAACP